MIAVHQGAFRKWHCGPPKVKNPSVPAMFNEVPVGIKAATGRSLFLQDAYSG